MQFIDPKGWPNFQVEHSDLRSHYERVAQETLFSIWRHKRLIATLVVAALVLAGLIIPLIPRKYSAEALVYPNLFRRDQGTTVVVLANVDAAALISSEARLIRSDAIVRAVVKQLGLDRDPSANSWTSLDRIKNWIKVWLFPEAYNDSPFDRSVAMLRNKLSVLNDTRSYLISISYTTSSAEEAARVVNSFAIEYLREKAIQRSLDAVKDAEGELRRQLAIYGNKHPKVLQAAEVLDAARAALKAPISPQDSKDGVTLAVPNRTPTSPKGVVILGLSFVVSLLAGIGLAVWRDRRDAKRKQGLVRQTSHREAL